jgi:hypothetical protein
MEPQLQELLRWIDRLSDQFSELREGIRKALRVADDDPEMALIRARKVLGVCEWASSSLIHRNQGSQPVLNQSRRACMRRSPLRSSATMVALPIRVIPRMFCRSLDHSKCAFQMCLRG